MIPEFTEEELPPPGVHVTDLEELGEKMSWSRGRRKLLRGLEEALGLMANCGVRRAYLGGSFVTDKDRPNDIDGCYDVAEDATAEDLRRLVPIFPPTSENRARAKRMFGVDFFPAGWVEFESGTTFFEFFQVDRRGRRRGVLEIGLEPAIRGTEA